MFNDGEIKIQAFARLPRMTVDFRSVQGLTRSSQGLGSTYLRV
jgi:hypothetical protein